MKWFEDFRNWIIILSGFGAVLIIVSGYFQYLENKKQDADDLKKERDLSDSFRKANEQLEKSNTTIQTNLDSTLTILKLQSDLKSKSEEIADLYRSLFNQQEDISELTKDNLELSKELTENILGAADKPIISIVLGPPQLVKGQETVPKQYQKKFVTTYLTLENNGSYPMKDINVTITDVGGNRVMADGTPDEKYTSYYNYEFLLVGKGEKVSLHQSRYPWPLGGCAFTFLITWGDKRKKFYYQNVLYMLDLGTRTFRIGQVKYFDGSKEYQSQADFFNLPRSPENER